MANFSFNKVIIGGRLTAEPELKQTQSGISVCSIKVAVNRRVKQGDEQKADFFNVTAWRQTADLVARYFHKGSSICIVGVPFAPAVSAASRSSSISTLSGRGPGRVFSVTGTPFASATIAARRSCTSWGFFTNAEPDPSLTIRGTGHPAFRLISTNRPSDETSRAENASSSGFEPKS